MIDLDESDDYMDMDNPFITVKLGRWRRNWKATKTVKPPETKFKVRHRYRNNLTQTTFKINKRFWLDVEWAYKVRYENGNERVFTESHFELLVKEKTFRKIESDLDINVHFEDNELFEM